MRASWRIAMDTQRSTHTECEWVWESLCKCLAEMHSAQLSVYLRKMFRCLVMVTYVQVQWSISLGWDFIYRVANVSLQMSFSQGSYVSKFDLSHMIVLHLCVWLKVRQMSIVSK
jgi:hypothetical protein